MANAQLTLVPADTNWKLDEETKRIGREGLAQARAALAETPSPVLLSPALLESPALFGPTILLQPVGASLEGSDSENHDLLAA